MLLIHCPYGDKTLPELEFAYAGEAHIARPADPSAMGDEEWRDFLFIRSNPRGAHAERWRHIHGCARYFNAVRDTVSDKFLATYMAGEARPEIAPAKETTQWPRSALPAVAASIIPAPSISPSTGRLMRAAPAIPSPRRSSPMACISSAAASSIIAHAAY